MKWVFEAVAYKPVVLRVAGAELRQAEGCEGERKQTGQRGMAKGLGQSIQSLLDLSRAMSSQPVKLEQVGRALREQQLARCAPEGCQGLEKGNQVGNGMESGRWMMRRL